MVVGKNKIKSLTIAFAPVLLKTGCIRVLKTPGEHDKLHEISNHKPQLTHIKSGRVRMLTSCETCCPHDSAGTSVHLTKQRSLVARTWSSESISNQVKPQLGHFLAVWLGLFKLWVCFHSYVSRKRSYHTEVLYGINWELLWRTLCIIAVTPITSFFLLLIEYNRKC